MDSSLIQKFEFQGNYFDAYPSHQIPDYGSSSTSDGDYKLASGNPKKRAGRRKFKETRHPVYRGIRRRNGDKWVCELRNKKSRLWLGTYPTAEMAARAHDVAALALRGKSACLNFADSVWRLPVPVSTSDSDIRKAAVEAAEASRPQEGGDDESDEWGTRDCSDAESSGSISHESDENNLKEANEKEGMYFDEEALLFMPQLLVDMADGLLVSPPPVACVDSCNNRGFDFDAEISLWNF